MSFKRCARSAVFGACFLAAGARAQHGPWTVTYLNCADDPRKH